MYIVVSAVSRALVTETWKSHNPKASTSELSLFLQAAVVYEGQAVIKYGEDNTHAKITRLEGIGKCLSIICSTLLSHVFH